LQYRQPKESESKYDFGQVIFTFLNGKMVNELQAYDYGFYYDSVYKQFP
jgi:hypothetical protein